MKLEYNEHENRIFIPNEIFGDLTANIDSGEQCAFTYGFYYLVNWMYRYAKYGSVNVTLPMIKELIGYNPNTRTVNYIIKKGGLLDELGYTMSSTDYPISWEYKDGDLQFTMFSDLDIEIREFMRKKTGTNYKIKIPLKGLWRSRESMKDGYYDGTFYDISNTHEVRCDVFDKCMNSGLGVIGFYIYGYMKCHCQWHGNKFNRSMDKIGQELHLHRNTVDGRLNRLREIGLVDWEVNDKCKSYDGNIVREAHTYSVM